MIITKNENGNNIVISVEGHITVDNAPELNDVLAALDYNDLDLTIDFSKLSYISSAGLRVLLIARRNLPEGRMRIINVSDLVKSIFDMTGFSMMIPIYGEFEMPENVASSGMSSVPVNMSYVGLLQYYVGRCPDKPLVYFGNDSYSWEDLERCSAYLAGELSNAGIGFGTHVGIISKNSPNWIIAFLAIERLGAIAALVGFGLTAEEMIIHSKVGDITHLCVGDIPVSSDREEFIQAVQDSEGMIRFVYDIRSDIDFREAAKKAGSGKPAQRDIPDADAPALIQFTSGTSGKPKAILYSSYDRISSCEVVARLIKANEDDKICLFLPINHSFGFERGLTMSLLHNIPLYLTKSRFDLEVINTVEKNECTILDSVPAKIISIIDNPGFTTEKMRSLRSITIAGAAITNAQLAKLRNALPQVHFTPAYGLTEISPVSAVLYDDEPDHILYTVGKPVEDVEVQIRDITTGSVLPLGEKGEIYIKSKRTLVCYYKMPLNDQAMSGDGWIRTGDEGMLDDDGYLRITGRIKDIIIRGGENISPNEIADVLTEIDEITDAKVVGVPDERLGETVAAAICLKQGRVFDREKTDEYLATRLSSYKIPVYYKVYGEYPMLSNGKVNMLRLKQEMKEFAESGG